MDKVECVVVGAGPSGSACALSLARKGVETVLLERGSHPGEKNVASFVLFTPVLEQLLPDFREEAPLERPVTEQEMAYLGEKDFLQMRVRLPHFAEKKLAYSAFRSKFDAWFAEKAREAGAELLTGVCVSDLIVENGRVRGVRIGEEELYADVVVGADGVHSVVGRKAGLVEEDISQYILGVKEVLDLPPEAIEDRFKLPPGEGMCINALVHSQAESLGYISLYTNRDSISLAVFGFVDHLKEGGTDLYQRLQDLKQHHYLRSLVADTSTREYQAHIISNGGRLDLGKLYGDGVLLCGEAGGFNSYDYVGVPPGMLSGMAAAETVARTRKNGDYGKVALSDYIKELEKTAMARLLYQSRTLGRYLGRRGREDIPRYIQGFLSVVDATLEDEFSFVEPKPYPIFLDLYARLMEEAVPSPLRGPVRAGLKGASKLKFLAQRRKIRKVMGP